MVSMDKYFKDLEKKVNAEINEVARLYGDSSETRIRSELRRRLKRVGVSLTDKEVRDLAKEISEKSGDQR